MMREAGLGVVAVCAGRDSARAITDRAAQTANRMRAAEIIAAMLSGRAAPLQLFPQRLKAASVGRCITARLKPRAFNAIAHCPRNRRGVFAGRAVVLTLVPPKN